VDSRTGDVGDGKIFVVPADEQAPSILPRSKKKFLPGTWSVLTFGINPAVDPKHPRGHSAKPRAA